MGGHPHPVADTPRLVFLHVPRVGGTSLHEAFGSGFPPEQRCPDRFSTLDRIPPARLAQYRFYSGHFRFDHLAHVPPPRFLVTVLRDPRARILSLYRFWRRHRAEDVKIHGLEGPRIARARGLMDFLHSEEPIVVESIDNAMACQLMGDARPLGHGRFATHDGRPLPPAAVVAGACDALLHFDCVGFTESLGALHDRVTEAFGLPAAPVPHANSRDMVNDMMELIEDEPVTPEINARLLRLTWLDAQVLQFARHDPRIRRA